MKPKYDSSRGTVPVYGTIHAGVFDPNRIFAHVDRRLTEAKKDDKINKP